MTDPKDPGALAARLRELAEWFDNPNLSPLIRTPHGTPGMLLRDIASEVEKTRDSGGFKRPE